MQGPKALRGMYALMVLVGTASVAYFQALGANKLVEASLALPLLQLPPRCLRPHQPPWGHPASTTAARSRQHDGIMSIGPGAFQVDRALVDRLMADPTARNAAYAASERGASGTYALKFQRIRPGGWAHALGLRVGDRLTRVNDHELKDPRHAIEAYAALRTAKDLVLSLERNGKVESVRIAIR